MTNSGLHKISTLPRSKIYFLNYPVNLMSQNFHLSQIDHTKDWANLADNYSVIYFHVKLFKIIKLKALIKILIFFLSFERSSPPSLASGILALSVTLYLAGITTVH